MWLERGVHHLAPAEIERFIREGLQQGGEVYVLPETVTVKRWSLERFGHDLPDFALDPPDTLAIGQDRVWGDALYDSLWGGVRNVGQKVGIVWPGKIVAQRDPEQYAIAIDCLSHLCTDWRGSDYEEKELVVL